MVEDLHLCKKHAAHVRCGHSEHVLSLCLGCTGCVRVFSCTTTYTCAAPKATVSIHAPTHSDRTAETYQSLLTFVYSAWYSALFLSRRCRHGHPATQVAGNQSVKEPKYGLMTDANFRTQRFWQRYIHCHMAHTR